MQKLSVNNQMSLCVGNQLTLVYFGYQWKNCN